VETFLSAAKLLLELEEARGNKVEHFRVKRYLGWAAGSVGYGLMPGAALVKLSGHAAAQHWRTFAAIAERVSRLDLAVTVKFEPPAKRLAERLYWHHGQMVRGRGKPPRTRLALERERGQTFYIGSTSSDLLGRVYDKEKESGAAEYAGCYRWELQDSSKLALHRLRRLGDMADERPGIQSHVQHYFTKRGSACPIDGTGVPLYRSVHVQRTDDDRKLSWLRTTARPTVQSFAARGKLAAALHALGFELDDRMSAEASALPPLEFDPRTESRRYS
jgi:hypothetical protein